MKNNIQKNTSKEIDFNRNEDEKFENIKTTNVNILLNRVRLDQKKTLKKRIIFSLFLITVISCLAVYFAV